MYYIVDYTTRNRHIQEENISVTNKYDNAAFINLFSLNIRIFTQLGNEADHVIVNIFNNILAVVKFLHYGQG